MRGIITDKNLRRIYDYIRACVWRGDSIEVTRKLVESSGINDALFNKIIGIVSTNFSTGSNSLYLELIKKCILDEIYDRPENRDSRGYPLFAHSMVGKKRLDNIHRIAESVLSLGVQGDWIETGVWRGGSCILMRAILKSFGITDRVVWVADSFQGLPLPNADLYPQDVGREHLYRHPLLAVSLEEVRSNFEKYDLLDDQVRFIKGWFSDTLPSAPIEKLSILRLDGDMYESTMVALTSLYDKLSYGGFVIVDDYGLKECNKAILDFRSSRNINDEIYLIELDRNDCAVFWQKIGH
ncbi:MAG: class I SAM-dependent methyltransferase [Magnetococcales bacterium]|nr:class I SAM-dependent methyltransferase [Magnetococcales bacterium]